MDVSCALLPTPATPDHARLAEELGYRRAWAYDSPALGLDVWMVLGLAATRTRSIGLGPAAIVPSLRHVVTTAAAILSLEALAPGRVAVVVGSGFTGRMAMGQRPLRWSVVEAHLRTLRALLRGEMVEVEGAQVRLLHLPGQAPARPVEVPMLVAAAGPRGLEVGRRAADGVMTLRPEPGFAWSALLAFGTVLDQGEDTSSLRLLEAAGPGAMATYHALYEQRDPRLARLPGGERWAAAVDALPGSERHLRLHEGHLSELTDLDRQVLNPPTAAALTLTGTASELRQRLAEVEERGTTELVYQPMGPDIPRELTAFAQMAGLG
jgi:5,10-methylenetetrahydromethanopterin reductase